MKIVFGSIVIIAGLVIAAGGGLVGVTNDESAEVNAGCCAASKAVAAKSAEGGCGPNQCPTTLGCGAQKSTLLTSTEAGDGTACDKACGTKVACEGPCPVAGACEGQCPVSKVCDGPCPLAVAMEKLPKMTYAVASENVCCGEQAD